ncbi:MAG: type I secretion system permease/ATPase [Hyphomicrobium sp.]
MSAAMRRLEDLLQDPAPPVAKVAKTQRPARIMLASTDEIQEDARDDDDEFEAAHDGVDTDEAQDDADDAAVDDAPATKTADAPRRRRHVWTSKAEAGPKAPPSKPQAVAPSIRRPAAAGLAPTAAPRFGGVLDALMSRLLGPRDGEIKDAIAASRGAIRALIAFSAVISVATLAGPIYVMLVIDRALPSGSPQLLATLAAVVATIYFVIGLLDLARARIVARVGAEIEMRLASSVFSAGLSRAAATPGEASALVGFDGVRQFFAGPAPLAALRALWAPIYLAAVAVIDWRLGAAGAISALALVALAWIGQRRVRRLLRETNEATADSHASADAGQRNSDALSAMGMAGAFRAHWHDINAEAVSWRLLAADRLSGASVLVKTARLLLHALMLAFAAHLAMTSVITVGAAIAATLIFALALGPIAQMIGCWRDVIAAQDGFAKLEDVLSHAAPEACRSSLAHPKGALEAQSLRIAAQDSRTVTLTGVAFSMAPGQSLAILGPSGSGKSTLARAIAGLNPPKSGAILLDGSRLDQWHSEDLGRHIGYVPQGVELFAGTVADNIARFRPDAKDRNIFAAAKQAHAHDMIIALPKGYETELGPGGSGLSYGQRQRIALARALYGDPSLVILDEPSSNLDSAGADALSSALDGMKLRGQTVVIVSRDGQAAGDVDLLLLLDGGRQRAFGKREDVIKTFTGDAALTTAIGSRSSLALPLKVAQR